LFDVETVCWKHLRHIQDLRKKIGFNKLDTLRKTKISVISLVRHGPHRLYRFLPTVLNGVGNCPAEDDFKDSDFIAQCYVEKCILQRPSKFAGCDMSTVTSSA
jgi:hypothetical protein